MRKRKVVVWMMLFLMSFMGRVFSATDDVPKILNLSNGDILRYKDLNLRWSSSYESDRLEIVDESGKMINQDLIEEVYREGNLREIKIKKEAFKINTAYKVRIFYYNQSMKMKYTNWINFYINEYVPEKPDITNISNGKAYEVSESINLSFTNNVYADKYELEVKSMSTNQYLIDKSFNFKTSHFITSDMLKEGETYEARVRYYNGYLDAWSEWSNEKTFTIEKKNDVIIVKEPTEEDLKLITKGSKVKIVAVGSNEENVKQMKLFIDDELKKEDAKKIDYTWDTTELEAGKYDLKFKMTLNDETVMERVYNANIYDSSRTIKYLELNTKDILIREKQKKSLYDYISSVKVTYSSDDVESYQDKDSIIEFFEKYNLKVSEVSQTGSVNLDAEKNLTGVKYGTAKVKVTYETILEGSKEIYKDVKISKQKPDIYTEVFKIELDRVENKIGYVELTYPENTKKHEYRVEEGDWKSINAIEDAETKLYKAIVELTETSRVDIRCEGEGAGNVSDVKSKIVEVEEGAGKTFTLSGKVKNDEGVGLLSVKVKVGEKSTYTDTSGNFMLRDIKRGTHTIEISKVGYDNYEKEMLIDSDKEIEVELYKIKYSKLEGTVKDKNGEIVRDAEVVIGDKKVKTNYKGSFYIYSMKQGLYDLVITKYGYEDFVMNIEFREDTNLEIELSKKDTCIVGGEIRDRDGKKLRGAKVIIDGQEDITDYSGKFWYDNLVKGEHTITITLDKYEDINLKWNFTGNEWLPLKMKKKDIKYKVYGVVKTENGSPISNARVEMGIYLALTDSYGKYEIENVRDGSYSINITHDDYKKFYKSVKVEKNVWVPATLENPPKKYEMKGIIMDPEGKPLEKVKVKIGTRSDLTDEGGKFEITGLREARYPFEITKEGYKTHSEEIIITGSHFFSKRLKINDEKFVFEGEIKDKEGNLIPGAKVELENSYLFANQFGQFKFKEVQYGKHMVKISAENHKSIEKEIELKNSLSTSFELERLKTESSLIGFVKDKMGKGILGAKVKVGEEVAYTNMLGMYKVSNISDGEYEVKVEKEGYRDYSQKFKVNGNAELNIEFIKEEEKKKEIFKDISNSSAKATIEDFYKKGIVSGYGDGTFRPNEDITGEEFLSIVMKFKNIRPAEVMSSYWADKFVESAIQNGLVTNEEANKLGKAIDSKLAVKIILRADGKHKEASLENVLEEALKNGIEAPIPNREITREEACIIIDFEREGSSKIEEFKPDTNLPKLEEIEKIEEKDPFNLEDIFKNEAEEKEEEVEILPLPLENK